MLNQWKEIAWYGVRFKIPPDWQPSQIGIRYLLFEDESGATMEIKWTPIKGKFSHKAHLKRLASLQKRQIGKSIKAQPVSAEWETALSHFDASEFSWKSDSTHGRGVILYCATCHNATLIQFFHKSPPKIDLIATNILNSFRDHRDDGRVLWSVYDIRALIPETFELKHHRFEAGRYELNFADGGQQIILYRWAPAAVLLHKQDLVKFAGSVTNFGKTQPVAGKMNACDTVEWSASPDGDWGRKLSRFKGSASYHWLGLWHLEDKNRILGVHARGKKPLDTQVLDDICKHYETV